MQLLCLFSAWKSRATHVTPHQGYLKTQNRSKKFSNGKFTKFFDACQALGVGVGMLFQIFKNIFHIWLWKFSTHVWEENRICCVDLFPRILKFYQLRSKGLKCITISIGGIKEFCLGGKKDSSVWRPDFVGPWMSLFYQATLPKFVMFGLSNDTL